MVSPSKTCLYRASNEHTSLCPRHGLGQHMLPAKLARFVFVLDERSTTMKDNIRPTVPRFPNLKQQHPFRRRSSVLSHIRFCKMRVPNMKVVQTHSTVPDASIFTTTIFEALPPFAAAQATPAVDVTSHGKSFRFGAVGRRPQMHTPSPTTPDHTTPEQTSEAIEVRSPEEISDTEKRQVQAANPCPSGLQYIKCSDGSFEGCGNKNICAINATTASGAVASTTAGSQSTRRTTTAPSSTAPGIQTATRGSSTTAPSSTTSDSTAPTPSPSSSSKPSVGGIAGGAVGGILAILALLCLFAFLFRRHRRTIEKRRAASLPTNNFPSKSASYRDKPRQHNRSMSTANDVFAFVGKVAGGAGGGAYNAVSSYTIPHHTRQRSIFRSFPKEGEENYYDDDGDGRISPTGGRSGQQDRMWV